MGIAVTDQWLKDIEASDRRGKKHPSRRQILPLLSAEGSGCGEDRLALPTGHLQPRAPHLASSPELVHLGGRVQEGSQNKLKTSLDPD